MAQLDLLETASASVPTPSTGRASVFIDTSTGKLASKDDAGAVTAYGGSATIADGDKGDITTSASGATWTIDNDVVTNAKAANMAVNTIKGRITSGTGDPEDLTPAQARKILRPVNALSISSGVVNIDCSLGVDFTLSLTANVTSITFSNLQGSGYITEIEVEITQDATGSRTVALPAAFKALGGSDTAVSPAANSVTVLSAKTWDNGTKWRYAMQESA